MGGRIETATAAGQGTSFRLVLPLTTAVTQVVMLRCGELSVAVPVDAGRDACGAPPPSEIEQAYASGSFDARRRRRCPSSGSARCCSRARAATSRPPHAPVVVIRSAAAARGAARRRGAGQPGSGGQEPRAAAVAPARPGRHDAAGLGRGGADLQPGGAGHAVRRRRARAPTRAARVPAPADRGAQADGRRCRAPLVLVVDDSLTVRRVTQRLLAARGLPRRAGQGRPGCAREAGRGACRRWCCRTSRCRAWTASTWCATCAPTRAWPTCR